MRGVTKVHIFDKIGFCTGTLADFSESGLCISDLPRTIHTDNGLFKAIIIGPHLYFKVQIKEEWKSTEGLTSIVGGTIAETTKVWGEMVKTLDQLETTSSKTHRPLHV